MAQENLFNSIALFSILASLFLLKLLFFNQNRSKKLPPGPPAFPIIGNLHLLKQPIHRTVHHLSHKYGPVMFLRFGARKVVVVSSPEAAEECFTKNDIIFANRPRSLAGKLLNYNFLTMGVAPYGDHWRNLRRLVTVELLSSNRLTMLSNIRQDEIQSMLKEIHHECSSPVDFKKPVKVELRSKLSELSFNIMMRMIAGKRYHGKDVTSEEAREFKDIIREVVEFHGGTNLEDFFPVFQWVDIQGVKKRMMRLMKKMDHFFQSLVDERRRIRSETNKERTATLIDVMLSLQETDPEYNSDAVIKAVILSLLIAGTETSSTTVEWAMAFLLNNPEAKEKASAEILSVIGADHMLEDKDLPKLNYLHNVINETLRLRPPAPLLVPRESSQDSTLCGFHIPKGTMLLTNIWSIQSDPNLWEDSAKFRPERFDGGRNEGYKMFPFGSGRRACPGAIMGRRVVGLALGALLQAFEWEREGKEEIDVTDIAGLTTPKKDPLEALCKPRQNMIRLLS